MASKTMNISNISNKQLAGNYANTKKIVGKFSIITALARLVPKIERLGMVKELFLM